jgi:DNA-directed RNA polymerase specialized sigma subunit
VKHLLAVIPLPKLGPLTQQQIADLLGITRARVMQIEQKALRKLKMALEKGGTSDNGTV